MTKRAGATLAYRQFIDPKATCSYAYEFCDGELGTIWNGGKMTFRNWKTMQMAFVGGEIPILRCYLHDPLQANGTGACGAEEPMSSPQRVACARKTVTNPAGFSRFGTG